VVERVKVKYGLSTIVVNLEVANLQENTPFIIGADIMHKIGIHLQGVQINWPVEKSTQLVKPTQGSNGIKGQGDVQGKDTELSDAVGEDGITLEWRKVLSDNAAILVSSVCKLPYSEVALETQDAKPSYVRQYKTPQGLVSKVVEQVNEWYNNNWAIDAPSDSRWNSPLLAAAKPATEKGQKNDIQVCLDARFLNKKIEEMPDSSMPSMRDEIINNLEEFQCITVIYLKDCYHQFRLRESDWIKTTFTVNGRRSMFVVAPFGIKTLTGHVQRVMEELLRGERVLPFQDDITIVSFTEEEHIAKVKRFLELLTYTSELRINMKKSKFFKTSARILGMMVSRDGIRMDPRKIEAITNWERPTTGTEMQQFLGSANYNRDFTHEFAGIAAPLEACRTMKIIEWTEERIQAFEQIKEIFARNLALRHVKWDQPMTLTTDACQLGVGAWIGQYPLETFSSIGVEH
jgi:hypothetical protein